MILYARPDILGKISRDKHALIEASAGTGKTHTIEHLVLDLILNGQCTVDQILVMTFTEKATAELRSRIRHLLEGVLAGTARSDDHDPAQVIELGAEGERTVENALFAFDRAPIFTIHAFCARVLSDLAFETRGNFESEVVDGRRAFHEAFRAELREHFTTETTSASLLERWLSGEDKNSRENLTTNLETLLWEGHFQRYLAANGPDINSHALANLVTQFDSDALIYAYRALSQRAANDANRTVEAVANAIRGAAGVLHEALNSAGLGSLPETYKVVRANGQGLPAGTRKLLETIDAVRVAISLEARIVDEFLPWICKRLSRDKRERGRIDYADMLEWVWQALDGQSGDAAVSALRERYHYAVIDEFQDTDDLQWRIFRRIFLESDGKNLLYLVGDPKQAIYSFRGADVFTYLTACSEMSTIGIRPIPLTENFRSSGALIDALNCVFDQRAEPALFSGTIRYEHPVRCGRPDLRALNPDGSNIVPVTLLRYAPDGGNASAARTRGALGRYIAGEIHRILNEPQSRIAIEEFGNQRQLQPSDIFILTRSGGESAEIGSYLRELGIPFAFYKKAGLFETPEAYDVLDILRAIEEPGSRSRRLRAWASPFFGVPYRDLFGNTEAPTGHPLNERLYEWKALADEEKFAELFDRLLDGSGLAGRELFLANSERELTNYQHLFELLLELAVREQLSLDEIIARLDSFVNGIALPGGLDSDVQRLESERSAVQIMSVHMSKGLQAAVVFLFGGTGKPPDRSKVSVCHDDDFRRRILVGKTAKDLFKTRLAKEEIEENERLAYVAMTRARIKLYLPIYPDEALKRPINGYYSVLNNRLKSLCGELSSSGASALFTITDVPDSSYESEKMDKVLSSRLQSWSPPDALLDDDRDGNSARQFARLRDQHPPLITRSYTSLTARVESRSDVEPEEFKYDIETSAETADLRGGRSVGIFLHEIIEKLELDTFDEAQSLAAWRARDDIQRFFTETMRRHRVTESRWLERGTEVIFNALRSRIQIPGRVLGPLYRCPNVREMEFAYPIPERTHPLLEGGGDGAWSVERGYLKGFVDFIFEQDGLYFFADWKSDLLESYEPDAVAAHVDAHYGMQAKIYSVGIVRLLQIRNHDDYDRRFGGLLYLFLRGIRPHGPSADGVYFHRPSWEEVVEYERSLMGVAPPAWSDR